MAIAAQSIGREFIIVEASTCDQRWELAYHSLLNHVWFLSGLLGSAVTQASQTLHHYSDILAATLAGNQAQSATQHFDIATDASNAHDDGGTYGEEFQQGVDRTVTRVGDSCLLADGDDSGTGTGCTKHVRNPVAIQNHFSILLHVKEVIGQDPPCAREADENISETSGFKVVDHVSLLPARGPTADPRLIRIPRKEICKPSVFAEVVADVVPVMVPEVVFARTVHEARSPLEPELSRVNGQLRQSCPKSVAEASESLDRDICKTTLQMCSHQLTSCRPKVCSTNYFRLCFGACSCHRIRRYFQKLDSLDILASFLGETNMNRKIAKKFALALAG